VKFGAGPKFDILMGAIFVMRLEAWLLAPSSAAVISKLNGEQFVPVHYIRSRPTL